MQIRKMIPQDKKKQRIYLEDDTVLSLYNGEIHRWHLQEEADISESTMQEILLTLKKRARERSFYLLKNSDKTEAQIRRKLKEGFYPPSVIEETICFLRDYGYVDDFRYARLCAEQMKEKKSRREITGKLRERGVSGDIIGMVLAEAEPDEEAALDVLLEKKLRGKDPKDLKTRDKICQYFYRKGYSLSMIEHAYRGYLESKNEDGDF